MPAKNRSTLKRFGGKTILVWTILIGTLLGIRINDNNHELIYDATNEARDYFRLNLFYRTWASKMGGVYVPVDKVTPNPYLQVPNRDITTSDNHQLTLVNPAYMTRMVFEEILTASPDPIINKITSLKPLNPVNAPDEWEKQSLMAFDRKEYSEHSEVTEMSGQPYLRFISAFTTSEACLKCHAHQGYKVGDVRGGIVISVPLAKKLERHSQENWKTTGTYGLIWLVGSIGIAFAANRRSRDEEARRQSEERHRSILRTAMDGIWSLDAQGRFIEANETYCRMSGYSMPELLTMSVSDVVTFETASDTAAHIQKVMELGEDRFESRHRRKDGSVYDVEVSVQYRTDDSGRFVVFVHDISERKHAEEDKNKLESQLQQAQKMESVGRLAGGVAHDFNNMLSVILGHAELGLMKIAPDDPLVVDLKEISKTAERSADLTRQLLAFARKQTVSPKVIDLNDTVTAMLKMLQRLIGEDIHLTWHPANELWQVRIDPSQIDQILANLCVNARDAIEDTGRITIETANSTIDASYCANNPEASPGDYVRLVVSDDGKGMNRETLAHIFEPFYTTKEMGKGTGLGLATVYGAVKQNNGFINIYSEPGKGTTFSIYLPREASSISRKDMDECSSAPAPRGQETILLVEDEAAILNITAIMLEKQGYTVLKADTPGRAMELAREHVGAIHLLMTDVIMPEMNGRDLAKNILSGHPQIKRLFMSGYTADVIANHGVLDEGVHFIQKPFSLPNMAAMVRAVLDS